MVLSFLPVLYYMHMHFHVFSTLGILWCTMHIKMISQRNPVFQSRNALLRFGQSDIYQARICDHTTRLHFPGITNNQLFFLPFLSEKTKKKMQPPIGYKSLLSRDSPAFCFLTKLYYPLGFSKPQTV